MSGLLVLVVLVTACQASYPDENALYEDMLVQDLYKRLSELADPGARAQRYQYEDLAVNPYPQSNWMNDIALESREFGETDLRDHEYLQHSAIGDGFQYISGGAGEGKQHLNPKGTQENTQEVKSDEGLPFYCHPPNPCPKGYTAKDGCHDFTEDSAEFQQEWILKMQGKRMCACDEEHMFKCPTKSNNLPDSSNGMEEQQLEQERSVQTKYDLDEMLNGIMAENGENPYISKANKREFLVAKKAPIVKRSVADIDEYLDQMKAKQEKKINPYLSGSHQELKRVAKKG